VPAAPYRINTVANMKEIDKIALKRFQMAARHQILCVNKAKRLNPHESITHVGGANADGTRWKMTEGNAINGIESMKSEFYVHVNEINVDVIVATHNGHKYIKTLNDGVGPDNLLRLPECH
jgi:hypothetical protein